jgi:tetratricopeptide (TPR) repeat protein
MAKRKKKSGGGAFGSGKKPNACAAIPQPQPVMSVRDSEHMTKMVHRIVSSRKFGSIEEMQDFVRDHLVGLSLEELEALLPDDEPPSDFDRAESLVAKIPEGTPPKEVVRIAQQAIALSEYCMGAWFEYGVHAEDTVTALERFEKGIEIGRLRFEELIKTTQDELGLWGYVEARDFLRLLGEKAKALEELGRPEEAVEVYEEILALSPLDELGVRCALLRLHLIQRRLDAARALLERFPNDVLVDMAYGRALLEIVEAADQPGFELPDPDRSGAVSSPGAFRKSLGPEFKSAIETLNRAVKVNPFVPMLMTHGSILDVSAGEFFSFGGPNEALVYVQEWCWLWFAAGIPFLLLADASLGNLKRLAKSPQSMKELTELFGQLEQLEALNQAPWWARFDEMT